MKRIILGAAIIALVAIGTRSNAQDNAQNNKKMMHTMPEFGVKGGVSLTGVTNLKGNERTTGHVGIFMHHTITKNWCFQPELLYSAQGQHFKGRRWSKQGTSTRLHSGAFYDAILPGKKILC
jgi:hypothetical protein